MAFRALRSVSAQIRMEMSSIQPVDSYGSVVARWPYHSGEIECVLPLWLPFRFSQRSFGPARATKADRTARVQADRQAAAELPVGRLARQMDRAAQVSEAPRAVRRTVRVVKRIGAGKVR